MADGSRHSLFSVEESSYGITPASDPALDTVRITGTTLALTKDSFVSEEIRDDRQIYEFRQGANQIGGDINFELSYTTFDDYLQAVLQSSDWASPATTGTTTISATGTGYSRGSGSFLTDGFLVGQTVTASGFTGSGYNGKSTITAVDALTMTTTPFSGGSHGVEAGDGDELIVASPRIIPGTTRKYFSFIRYFADIGDYPYHIFAGVEMNTLALTIAANAMVTGTFSVFGKSLTLAADLTDLGTPTYNTPTTTTPFDSFTGAIQEGGSNVAVVTEITLNLTNTIAPKFVVGSANSIFPSDGKSNLTGQITAYFENSTLLNKFINETDSSAIFDLTDGAGNVLRFQIPKLNYTGAPPDVSGEGPITLAMPFQGSKDATTGTNLIIERTAA